MKYYNLTLDDMNENYFHFTKSQNLDSIKIKGLLPKKGKHAKFIEESNKVFFIKGLDNLLILFDCWINVNKKIPIIKKSKSNLIYGTCSKLMKSKYFPMIFVDIWFKLIKTSKRHKEFSYKIFDEILEESVLLNLDIKENIDFKFNDIDEIKSQNLKKRHLIILGYSKKYSDMDSNKMDEWNLHTLSNHGISSKKISLCYINNSCKMKDILLFALKNTKIDLKDICPVLYDYLVNRKIYFK